MLELASTKVIVILQLDPASLETNIYFTTATFAEGTVYRVVRSVVVKSVFAFIKLFAINLKRSFQPLLHPLSLVDMLYLIY